MPINASHEIFEAEKKYLSAENIDDKIVADRLVEMGRYNSRACALYMLRTAIYSTRENISTFRNAKRALKICLQYKEIR